MAGFSFNKQAYNTAADIAGNAQREQQNAKLADQQKKAYDQFQAAGINKAIIAAGQQLDPQTAASLSKTVESLGNDSPEASGTILKGVMDRIQMQAQLDRTQSMLQQFQNQGQSGSQTTSGTPDQSGASSQTQSDNSGGVMIPKITIPLPGGGNMDVVNQSVQNKILSQQKNIENQASLSIDAKKKFQDALPQIGNTMTALDRIEQTAKALPEFTPGMSQMGAKASMAYKQWSNDPATVKYIAAVGKELPALTRSIIGSSNRINQKELESTQTALGNITVPLETKLSLLDDWRGEVTKALRTDADSAGWTPQTLKSKYPAAYQALYTRKVINPQGKAVAVPSDQFEEAINKRGYKRF